MLSSNISYWNSGATSNECHRKLLITHSFSNYRIYSRKSREILTKICLISIKFDNSTKMIFSFIFVCFRTSFGYFFQFDLLAGRLTREFIRRCVLWKTSIINVTVCFELILKIKLENVKWLSSQRNLDEISSKLTYSGQAS
jgi:hypothetical protein